MNLTPICGIITEYTGTSPGPASGITYTIKANMPQGVVVIPGCTPSSWRWPDSIPVDAQAMVDTVVLGVLTESVVQWSFIERPALEECGS